MSTIEDLIWRQASKTLFLTREQYMEHLRAFAIEPVERGGTLIGAVLRKNAELHFVTFDTGVPITRDIVRDALAPQLEEYGCVETKTPKLDRRQHRFNEGMGFVKVGEDEFNTLFRLSRDGYRL
jgi:hypothetical protein